MCITCPLWVKSGKARPDHLTSAFHLKTDLLQTSQEVRFVPIAEVGGRQERSVAFEDYSIVNPLALIIGAQRSVSARIR
jgi:hypothetical protein